MSDSQQYPPPSGGRQHSHGRYSAKCKPKKTSFRRSVFVALLHEKSVLAVTEHTGEVGFPGGRVETQDKEGWLGALAREFHEETGARLPFLRYTHIGWGTPFYELRLFVGRIDAAAAAAINECRGKAEIDVRSWEWIELERLKGQRLRRHIAAAVGMLDALAASGVGRESEWRQIRPLVAGGAPPAAAKKHPEEKKEAAAEDGRGVDDEKTGGPAH